MRYNVAELDGWLLDAAVANARGHSVRPCPQLGRNGQWQYQHGSNSWGRCDEVSDEWEYGGPLIERERIELIPQGMVLEKREGALWNAVAGRDVDAFGPTALIAAMRAYVTSKLGDEVEL